MATNPKSNDYTERLNQILFVLEVNAGDDSVRQEAIASILALNREYLQDEADDARFGYRNELRAELRRKLGGGE